jgi:hypothetical protein
LSRDRAAGQDATSMSTSSSPHTTPTGQSQIADLTEHLQNLRHNRDYARLNTYLLALSERGWSTRQLGTMLSLSQQAISQKIVSARTQPHPADVSDLPLPPAPARAWLPADQTASGLPIPDSARIEAEQAARVESQLAAIGAAPIHDRLSVAADIVNQAEEDLATLRARRAILAWSLTCYENISGLQRAGHWQPDEFYAARARALAPTAELAAMSEDQLRDLGSQRGIPHHPHARTEYQTTTISLLSAAARRQAAIRARDQLIGQLVTRDANGRLKGVSAVARIIGRTQPAVTKICVQQGI